MAETKKSKAGFTDAEPKKSNAGFTDAERAAMKERAAELKLEAKRGKDRAKGEKELLSKVEAMPAADRVIAERIHALVTEHGPHLMSKTMYGMPAYANAAGKTVCFFQAASKWDTRYAALVFEDPAQLDDGDMWPTSFAIKKLTPAVEKQVAALLKKALS